MEHKSINFENKFIVQQITLLEWDESGRVGSSDTWSSVLDRLVGDSELSEVESDHLRLDLGLKHKN